MPLLLDPSRHMPSAPPTGTNRLAKHFNLGTLNNLPDWSGGPKSQDSRDDALRKIGVEAVQEVVPGDIPETSFPFVLSGRVLGPADAETIASRHKQTGALATSLHVGTGLESDDETDRLVASVLDASARHGFPLFIETHRGTVTQDVRRTLDLTERFPDIRYNADLSHWYTGQSLDYGDFAAKLDALEPVFQRVRYIHGRIGTSCCMQVGVSGPDDQSEHVQHFRALWRRVCSGFLKTAEAGEILPFAAELLPHTLRLGERRISIGYAHLHEGEETTDRWEQAEILWAIMSRCARDAGLAAPEPATPLQRQQDREDSDETAV